MSGVHFDLALTPDGWQRNVSAEIGADGRFGRIARDDNPQRFPVLAHPVVPGITDLHSHAFQYAMAGLTEVRRNPVDSFWSWRDMMYFFAHHVTPQDMEAIAARLYLDLLRGGYTGVVEFHYVHNDLDGSAYAPPETLSLAIMRGAERAGLHLTHMPVFYAHANFGGVPPTDAQRRFITDIDRFGRMIEALKAPAAAAGHALAIAPHSLRAVTEVEIAALMAMRADLLPGCQVHMHVAEQVKEVEDSLAHCGKRPVELLFDLAPVDESWCLIHATHLSDAEVAAIAGSGATVGLCPMTEANLGDGIFRAGEFLAQGGHIGVGSDSNIATAAWDELRMLEYSQRLRHRQRNILSGAGQPHVGSHLWAQAAEGGGRAAGRATGAIATGQAADFCEIVCDEPGAMAAVAPEATLDFHVFAGRHPRVGDVHVGGRKIIADGRHPDEDAIVADYARAMKRLAGDLRERG